MEEEDEDDEVPVEGEEGAEGAEGAESKANTTPDGGKPEADNKKSSDPKEEK